MSHYAYSNQKTTAGNFAAKASYFEKKLAELNALKDKRLEVGAAQGVAAEVLAAEIAAIDAKVASIIGRKGTGPEDYFHKSGNDTLASGIVGGMAFKLGLGEHPKDGDYLALFRGINPRTGEFFVPEARGKQITVAIEKAEAARAASKSGDKTGDRLDWAQLMEGTKEEKEVNLGYSSCVSLQKSISMTWAVSSDDERKEIEQIFMEAVREALEFEESQGYVGARVGGTHGVDTTFVAGKGMSLIYLHCTARRALGAEFPDPQLHVHIERPNFVVLADGSIRSLDARQLYARQREFGAMVDVFLFEKLKKVRPDLAAAMVFDRAGHGMRLNDETVSRERVEANSKRNAQINKAAAEVGRDGAAARQAIATRTATLEGSKSVEIGQALDGNWRESIGKIEPKESTAEFLQMPSLLEVQQMLFAGNSVIKESDIERVTAQLLAGNGGSDRHGAVRNEIFKQLGLIEIPERVEEDGAKIPKRFTTQEMIDIESDCLKAVYAGLNDQRWTLDKAKLVEAIEQYQEEKRATQKPGAKPFTLTDEQLEADFKLIGDGQFKFLKGAAGVGKSASIAPIYKAYKEAGFCVIGVAPQSKQARELAGSTGMPAQTVHSLLISHEMGMEAERAGKKAKPGQLVAPGTVIICDEAGTLDTYTMQALMRVCHERQAMLVMAGDRNQHGAVPTASLFGTLHDAVGDRIATIEKISRQTEEFQPTAQALYREETHKALELMIEKNQLKVFAEHINEADQLVADVLADLPHNEKGWAGILVLADTNEQVRALNEKFRDARIANGELSDDPSQNVSIETLVNGRRELIEIAVGDRLLLRKNASDAENLKVYNGDLGTVLAFERVKRVVDGEEIEDTKFTILRDDGETAQIWSSEYQAIQHGYAMTSTKSQGMTVLQAYYLPGSTADLHSLYVAYTRGILGANIYLNESQWAEFFKAVEHYRYKETALSLMPERLAAIQANAQNQLPVTFTTQSKTVLERIEGSSQPFSLTALAEEKTRSIPKIEVIPDTKEDRALARAYGNNVIQLSDFDGSREQLKGKRLALVQTPNPPVPATQDTSLRKPAPQKTSLDERPHAGNVVANLLRKTKLLRDPAKKNLKPTVIKETQNEQRTGRPAVESAAAPKRNGAEQRAAEQPKRTSPFGIHRLRDAFDVLKSLGKPRDTEREPKSAARADEPQRAGQPTASNTQKPAASKPVYNDKLDPFAAFNRPAANQLRTVPSGNLVSASNGRTGDPLPDHAPEHRAAAGSLRWSGNRSSTAGTLAPEGKSGMKKFDKEQDRYLTKELRRDVDFYGFAETLGYKVDHDLTVKRHGAKYAPGGSMSGERGVLTKGGEEFFVRKNPDGYAWWRRDGDLGGDIFKLYQHERGGSFVDAKRAVEDFADKKNTPISKEQLAERQRQHEIDVQVKAEKNAKRLAQGTAKAERVYGLMGKNTEYLESRGISREVLADTRWKANIHGSACFPHHGPEKQFAGYEYRGFNYIDKKTGEDTEAKGFTTDTLKGVYVANGRCANPTEIRFCESGVDTLSAYQLATPEERQRILFVGTTGETGPNTEAAIKAMAERNNIQKFSMAYDRDKGGEQLTEKRTARLREAFPDAEIRDVREELGMQPGEDPNDLLRRRQAEQLAEQQREAEQKQQAEAAPKQEAEHATKVEPEHQENQEQQEQTRGPSMRR
jgi:conjugative relaxase-like TrwC/TraI family protein